METPDAIEKKTRERKVFGRQRFEYGGKVYVFEMSKSGVSACAAGRGQVESKKSFSELLAFIAGVELVPCVKPRLETVAEIDSEIDAVAMAKASNFKKIDAILADSERLSIELSVLGRKRAEMQTGVLL